MGVLQRFEQRLDAMVNGAFAKAFRSEVQPVEIAGALQRELDDKAVPLGTDRTVGPNHFVVDLSPHDHDRLGPYAGPLGQELAGMVTEHADSAAVALLGQVEVELVRAEDLSTGMFRVTSTTNAGVTAQPKARPLHEQVAPVAPAAPVPPVAPVATPEPVLAAEPVAAAPEPATNPRLVVHGTAYPLAKATVTIGRGADVDIRIDDPGVSRSHASFRLNQQSRLSQPNPADPAAAPCTVTDLASTNGTFVRDQRVTEAPLRDGDEIKVGSTTLVFRVG